MLGCILCLFACLPFGPCTHIASHLCLEQSGMFVFPSCSTFDHSGLAWFSSEIIKTDDDETCILHYSKCTTRPSERCGINQPKVRRHMRAYSHQCTIRTYMREQEIILLILLLSQFLKLLVINSFAALYNNKPYGWISDHETLRCCRLTLYFTKPPSSSSYSQWNATIS